MRRGAQPSPLVLALILAATFFAYLPALHGARLWDDDAHITRPELQSLHGLYRIWFDFSATQQYYPLLHTAFWIEHKLWGEAVLGYHLVNLLWHLTAVCLVYLILRRLNMPGSLLATAIFALHPVMVESVAWISEQKNTLSAVFYLSAMLTYLSFDRSRHLPLPRGEGSKASYILALALFLLGLLTKTVTATLPAALLVIFWWQRGTISLKRDLLPLVPFFALGAIAGVVTAWLERTQIGAVGADFNLTILERCLLAGRVVWFYIAKLVWPAHLIFIYPRWHIDSRVWWQWLFPIATLAATFALWGLRARSRGPLAAWLYFCGTLFPVLGFLNVYPFIFSFVADHFQYLASLGIIALASATMATGFNRLPQHLKPLGVVASVIVVALLASLTARQSNMYADRIALWQATIARNPECWMAFNNLGSDLYERGDNPDAIEHFRTALRLRPNYADAHKNLGKALVKQGANDEASAHFIAALRLNRHVDSDIVTNLGSTLLATGRTADAIEAYRAAARLQRQSWSAHDNLGQALLQARQYPEAAAAFERALELNPDALLTYNGLADAYAGESEPQKAAATVQHALELATARGDKTLIGNFRLRLKLFQNPNDADLLKNFAIQLAKAGHYREAIAKFEAARAIHPNDVAILQSLGLALTLSGEAPKAVESLQQAVQLAPDNTDLRIALGQALSSADRPPEAIKHFETALALNPNNVAAHTKLGSALLKVSRETEAIPHFERALELEPKFTEARVNLAIALAARGEGEKAGVQFQKAIDLAPNDSSARYNFGKFLARNGQFDSAIEQFRQAARLSPAIADIHQSLAEALDKTGQTDEAIEEYRAALRHNANSIPAYAKLAKRLAALNRTNEAIATAQQGIALAQTFNQNAAASELAQWLANYKAALPK